MKFVPLGEVATIDRATVNPNEIPGDTQYVGLEHITKFSREVHPVTAETARLSSTKHRFDQHQILYGKLRPYLAKIATPDFDGVCSTDILPLTPCESVDRSYLYYFLSQPSKVREVSKQATGANLPRVKPAALENLKIPLPPLDEQRRIAAILDKADAIRQKRRQAIAHLDTLTQSIFHDMFASIQDTETVANLAAKSKRSIRTGPFGSQLLHEEFTSEGVPVLGIDNVVENKFMWKKERYIGESKFQQLEKYEVFPDDVLITIMGTTGRCAVVPIGIPRSINTKHICAITPDTEKVLPEFLKAAFLYHPATQRFSKDNTRGAIMAGLNMGIIKKTPLPLASLSDQKTFVERSQRIDTFRTRLLNGHNSDLFASLQSRAFQGEL